MANLLYAGFRMGCYVGWDSSAGDYEPGGYCYGYNDYMASYYADLKPNTTYTIQRIDSSTRFRLALSSSNLKKEVGDQQFIADAFDWGYRADSSDAITFTTGASDIHLVVYYTNNSEYSTRVMLNEGSAIQPYEAPTVPLPSVGWIIQNNELTHMAFVNVPDKPFHGDSPYTMWRIDPNANDGMPYIGLMIGVPALAPELSYIYLGDQKVTKFYFGDANVSAMYYGDDELY